MKWQLADARYANHERSGVVRMRLFRAENDVELHVSGNPEVSEFRMASSYRAGTKHTVPPELHDKLLHGTKEKALEACTTHLSAAAKKFHTDHLAQVARADAEAAEAARIRPLMSSWVDNQTYQPVPQHPRIEWLYAEGLTDFERTMGHGDPYPTLVFRCLGQEYEYDFCDDEKSEYTDQYNVRTQVELDRWLNLPQSKIFALAVSRAREHFRKTFRPVLEGLVPDVEAALDAKGL